MTQSIKKTPIYPKGHLLAASGIAAFLSLSLLIFPSGEVEAKKTAINHALSPGEGSFGGRLENSLPFVESVENAFYPFINTDWDSAKALPAEAHKQNDNPLEQTRTIALNSKSTSITAVNGDTLSKIFNRAGIPAKTLNTVLASSTETRRLKIKVGQVFEFHLSNSGDLKEVRSELSNLETISLKRTDSGFVLKSNKVEPTIRTTYSYGEIESSLSGSAKKHGLPYRLAIVMADIFAYDIDFSKVGKGDQFEVIYEEKVVNGNVVGTGNILAARFTNLRQTYTAIRYTNGSYYNAQGISLRKAFLRTPVDFARISSRFSSGRKHPILNKIRAHQGVDYAAPRGTPIKAAGDGKVILAGRKGGYGNTVILQHGSSYKTLYAHMKGFAKGIRSGSSVKQGQIIGYIGTTGLSTGPHLHYEFQINGRHVDPLGQKKLMADPIASSEKAKLLKLGQPLLARMNREKASMLAMNKL